MKRILSLVLFLSIAMPVYAQNKAPVNNPSLHNLHKAIAKLRHLETELKNDPNEYSGHKAQAISDIDQALTELEAATKTN